MHPGDTKGTMYDDFDPASYPKYMVRYDGEPFGGIVAYLRADGPNHMMAIKIDGEVHWEHTGAQYDFDLWLSIIRGARRQVSPLYIMRIQHDRSTGVK